MHAAGFSQVAECVSPRHTRLERPFLRNTDVPDSYADFSRSSPFPRSPSVSSSTFVSPSPLVLLSIRSLRIAIHFCTRFALFHSLFLRVTEVTEFSSFFRFFFMFLFSSSFNSSADTVKLFCRPAAFTDVLFSFHYNRAGIGISLERFRGSERVQNRSAKIV